MSYANLLAALKLSTGKILTYNQQIKLFENKLLNDSQNHRSKWKSSIERQCTLAIDELHFLLDQAAKLPSKYFSG